jgi:hypothetical protein
MTEKQLYFMGYIRGQALRSVAERDVSRRIGHKEHASKRAIAIVQPAWRLGQLFFAVRLRYDPPHQNKIIGRKHAEGQALAG